MGRGYEVTDQDGNVTCHLVGCDCIDRGPWPLPVRTAEGWEPGEWKPANPPLPSDNRLVATGLHVLGVRSTEDEAILWEAESFENEARLIRPHPAWSLESLRSFAMDCAEHVLWVANPWVGTDDRLRKALRAARSPSWPHIPQSFIRVRWGEMEELWEEVMVRHKIAAYNEWPDAEHNDEYGRVLWGRALARHLARPGASTDAPKDVTPGTTPWAAVEAVWHALSDYHFGVALAHESACLAVGPNRIGMQTPAEKAESAWQEARFCELFGISGITDPLDP